MNRLNIGLHLAVGQILKQLERTQTHSFVPDRKSLLPRGTTKLNFRYSVLNKLPHLTAVFMALKNGTVLLKPGTKFTAGSVLDLGARSRSQCHLRLGRVPF